MKRLFALMLAAAMMLTMTACGGDGGTSSGGGGSSGGGETKDTLVIGHYGDTPNFDTHNNLNDNGMRINMIIYDPLVRMDSETYEIQPCIAKSWTVSDDGTEYTFAIKSGVKFSDGTDMTVDDVVFSLQRGMEMPMAVPSFARVTGVEKVDDSHVKVILDGPYPEFLFAMALPTAGILSKAAYESMGEEAYMENPIATGPYKVVDWRVGEQVTLEANEYYHMGEVPIKNVVYQVISDSNAAVLALESGDIDAYVDVPQSSFSRIERDEDLALYVGQAFAMNYLQLNCTKAPFDKLEARQALAYACDKEAILYGVLEGYGTAADTFALPEYLGYTEDLTKYPYDLEKAKELFEQAGVDENTEIELCLYDNNASQIAQIIQNSLHEIGITAKITRSDRSAFEDAALDGRFDVLVTGGTFTAPTIDEVLYTITHSSQMDLLNYGRYNNAEVDRLLDEARVTLDENERAKIYNELLQLLSEDVPLVPLLWRTKNIVASKDLKGVTANPWSFYNLYEFSWD